MPTSSPSPNTSSPPKRLFGIIVSESYFVTFLALRAVKLIADVDFYTRTKSILNLRFFSYFAGPAKISDLIIGVLSVCAIVGLRQMRLWGRWLAIALASASVAYASWFYSAVLIFRLWTLVPHRVWPYVKNTTQLGFGIYIVWYLLQPKAQQAFRQFRPGSASESDTNS
jgi:hypothetical protein